jgi:regulator of protease activity HflC (stomatin/prohibitin superfamily)
MNNAPDADEKFAGGKKKGELVLKSSDNQNVYVTATMQWRRDPEKVCMQQEKYCNVDDDEAFEELVLFTPLFKTIQNQVTVLDAITAYSGEGNVQLQKDIYEALKNYPEYKDAGVIVEGFTLDVKFEPAFIEPIVNRQIAIQQQSMYKEQTLAADQQAKVAQAQAGAEKNRRVVAAEGDKQVAILKAEQENAQVVLQAEAAQKQVVLQAEGAKQQVVLQAQGEKEAAQNRADAILAVGKSTAEAKKLEFTAYDAPGAKVYASMQIAESAAKAYSGIKGFIPEKMNITTLSDNFVGGVRSFTMPLGNNPPANQ